MSRNSSEIGTNSDYIKPASWRGNVKLSDVVLIISWKLDRRLVEEDTANLQQMCSTGSKLIQEQIF